MSGGEHRPGRFTQLDFDSLAAVADETQAEHAVAVHRPDVRPFSGTRHAFVLKPGAIQYTLDAALLAPSPQEGEEAAAGQAGSRQDVIQPFSGTRQTYALVPGG